MTTFIRKASLVPLIALAGVWLAGDIARAQDAEPAAELSCPSCDDGNYCTTDACDSTTGTCRHDPVVGDDHNPCTQDVCYPQRNEFVIGGCEHLPASTGTLCDDGNPCTVNEVCYCAPDDFRCYAWPEPSIACVGQARPLGTFCDDHNLCTVEDACDAGGRCAGRALDAGTICDDMSLCTTGETCQASADGTVACVGTPKDCDDHDACTVETCVPSTGACVSNPRDCDDRNPCTRDSCDPVTGCVREPVSGSCEYGDFCTGYDYCQGGNCIPGTGCPQSTDCEIWTCDWRFGCLHYDVSGSSCDEENKCVASTCVRGYCMEQLSRNCDDGNPCTSESCDPATGGCVYTTIDGSCSDGNACTSGDSCAGGVCRSGAPANCDDGNRCTLDACDRGLGCVHALDPSLADADLDGTPDPCDNCPTVPNPSQDPSACEQSVVDILLSPLNPQGEGPRILSWRSTHEVDVAGYNVVFLGREGGRVQLNSSLLPCQECTTGSGAYYTFRLSGRGRRYSNYVELVHADGRVDRFGPATGP